MSKSTRTTDTVKVGFGILWEIEVDYDVDSLNINTTGQQIRADKVSTDAVPEVVEDTVTVVLKHSSMRVEARVSKFGDLLGK